MSESLLRRRSILAASAVAGGGLLRRSLAAEPGSHRFYVLTGATAMTWAAGGFAAERRERPTPPRSTTERFLAPVALGAGAFAAFYAAARIARKVPILDDALSSVMAFTHEGSDALVLTTAVVNGVAEELFFRGAVYDAAGPRHPRTVTTASYLAVTAATGNPALVAASGVMGWLFATQRRQTGGIEAPIITHVTWSTLMLRYLPPLFSRRASRGTHGSPGSPARDA